MQIFNGTEKEKYWYFQGLQEGISYSKYFDCKKHGLSEACCANCVIESLAKKEKVSK